MISLTVEKNETNHITDCDWSELDWSGGDGHIGMNAKNHGDSWWIAIIWLNLNLIGIKVESTFITTFWRFIQLDLL